MSNNSYALLVIVFYDMKLTCSTSPGRASEKGNKCAIIIIDYTKTKHENVAQ